MRTFDLLQAPFLEHMPFITRATATTVTRSVIGSIAFAITLLAWDGMSPAARLGRDQTRMTTAQESPRRSDSWSKLLGGGRVELPSIPRTKDTDPCIAGGPCSGRR